MTIMLITTAHTQKKAEHANVTIPIWQIDRLARIKITADEWLHLGMPLHKHRQVSDSEELRTLLTAFHRLEP
jgi:hypothetical protein